MAVNVLILYREIIPLCFQIHNKQMHPFDKKQKSRLLKVMVQNLTAEL